MNNPVKIKTISAEQTRNLRQLVLRPTQKPEELIYPGDDDIYTIHFGLYANDVLSGIASLYKESLKGFESKEAWRLRGMATEENVRGMGYGTVLMEKCIGHIKKNNGKIFWCNARTTAEKFYGKFGMKRTGEVFFPEGLGEHVVMMIEIEGRKRCGGERL